MEAGNQTTNGVDSEMQKMSSDVTSMGDGIWHTTHLDIMIGDLQRDTTSNDSNGIQTKDQVCEYTHTAVHGSIQERHRAAELFNVCGYCI
jgi:hypothetical protein